jgi:hypothetical protein
VLAFVVTVATMAVGTVLLDSRGEATLGAAGVADVLWRVLAVAALLGPFGVCLGALIRNQVATVVGVIVIAAAVEPALSTAASEAARFGPLAGAPGGVLGGATADALLAPVPALAVVVAWAVAAFAAAVVRLRGRDLV